MRTTPGSPLRQTLVLFIALCGLCLGAASAFGATVAWVTTSTSSNSSYSYGNGVSALPDGSSIVTGYFWGTDVNFGNGVIRTSAYGGTNYSAFTEKVGADGAVLWVTTFTCAHPGASYGNGVSALPDGSSIVTGDFFGTDVDFGNGVRRTSAQGGHSSSAFTQKVGADGAVLRVTTSTSNSSSNAAGNGVSALPDGSSIVTGYFYGTDVDFGDGVPRTSANGGINTSSFTQQVGADGAVLWVTTPPPTNSGVTHSNGVSALPDGSSVVTGFFTGTDVNFGDGALRTSAHGGTSNSAFTEKVGAGGAVLWVTTSASSNSSDTIGNGVSALPDGSSIVTGSFQGTDVDLGNGVRRTSPQSGAGNSSFTQKVGADGAVLWVTTSTSTDFSYAVGNGASALPDGSSVITGYFYGTDVNFGDGAERISGQGGTNNSTFTQKVGADGAVLRVTTSTSSSSSDTVSKGVSALPDGTSIVTGYFFGPDVDFGDGVPRTSAHGGGFDSGSAFTQKILDAPQTPAIPTAVAGDTSAAVTITPIAGGSVTSYTVISDPGEKTCAVVAPAASCTMEGLTNGTSYRFRATATNAVGTGAASAWSDPITPTAAPTEAPTEAAAATVVVQGKVHCVATTCVTTGAVPAGATRITQWATTRPSGRAAAGKCTIRRTSTKRTYSCTVRLSRGTWVITTTARTQSAALSHFSKRVRVARWKAPVTG